MKSRQNLPNFPGASSQGAGESELTQALHEVKKPLLQATFFSLVASLLVLAPSAYMLEVYGRVIDSRNFNTLLMLTIMIVIAYVVMEMIEWARNAVMHQAAREFEDILQPRVFDAIFSANLKRAPGGNLQAMNDLKTLGGFIASPVIQAVMEAPVALVFLFLLFAISPILGWFAVIGAVVQTLIGWLNDKSTQPPLAEANRTAIAAQQYVDGTLRNTEVIRGLGMLSNIHRIWHTKQSLFLGQQAEASTKAGVYQSAGKFWQQFISSGLLGLSCYAMLNNELNGGGSMMVISGIFGGRVLAPLLQIVTSWQQCINAKLAWQRLDSLLGLCPKQMPAMPLPAPKGLLTVENVVAAPPGSSVPILKGVSFAVKPGETVAIVGPTGSGKTTLARLLVGLWPSVSGKVRLDGADIYTWNKEQLGPHIGYLPQSVELFEGTLAENIARFSSDGKGGAGGSPEAVEAAARAVGLHDMIKALPQQYDTILGREGIQLSGGQRQRIALARALYGQPKYVVLDEPNSSLDEMGDTSLLWALNYYKSLGTTFILITHRTHVLSAADKILVMRDGVAQAFGPRDDVLRALTQGNATKGQ